MNRRLPRRGPRCSRLLLPGMGRKFVASVRLPGKNVEAGETSGRGRRGRNSQPSPQPAMPHGVNEDFRGTKVRESAVSQPGDCRVVTRAAPIINAAFTARSSFSLAMGSGPTPRRRSIELDRARSTRRNRYKTQERETQTWQCVRGEENLPRRAAPRRGVINQGRELPSLPLPSPSPQPPPSSGCRDGSPRDRESTRGASRSIFNDDGIVVEPRDKRESRQCNP
jgi:hypothetical protein